MNTIAIICMFTKQSFINAATVRSLQQFEPRSAQEIASSFLVPFSSGNQYPYSATPFNSFSPQACPSCQQVIYEYVENPEFAFAVQQMDPLSNANLFESAPSGYLASCPPAAARNDFNSVISAQTPIYALPLQSQSCLHGHVDNYVQDNKMIKELVGKLKQIIHSKQPEQSEQSDSQTDNSVIGNATLYKRL